MEVAPRYKLLTLFKLFTPVTLIVNTANTVFTVYNVYTVYTEYTDYTDYTACTAYITSAIHTTSTITLFKPLTLLKLTLCKNTLFYSDCLDHQELKNTGHYGLWEFTPLTLLTLHALLSLVSLLKPLAPLNILFYFDC